MMPMKAASNPLFRPRLLNNLLRRGRGDVSACSSLEDGPAVLLPNSSPFHSASRSSHFPGILPVYFYGGNKLRILHHSDLPLNFHASCSSAAGPSNIVLIKSEDDFQSAYNLVKDDSLPAIFYFTATWCGPCRMIAPIIKNWSETYPHVTTFKIDIDEVALQSMLSNIGITSVPTLHFFHKGKKESEIVGADVARLNATAEKLFGSC